MGYLTNFIVYTLAMVGIIFVALMVFKNATNINIKGNSKNLKIIDSLSIGPRKTLYIISAGDEKFLIAGDVEKTSLISKLNANCCEEKLSAIATSENNNFSTKSFQDTTYEISRQKNYIDKSYIGLKTKNKNNSVIKNLAEVLRS